MEEQECGRYVAPSGLFSNTHPEAELEAYFRDWAKEDNTDPPSPNIRRMGGRSEKIWTPPVVDGSKIADSRNVSPTDVVEEFVKLAKEEGHTIGDEMVYVVNIGSPTDSAEHYRLSIALPDFIYHQLHRAYIDKRMSALTWKAAREALFAADIRPTGFSEFSSRMDGVEERLKAEEERLMKSIKDLKGVHSFIRNEVGDEELSETMLHALSTFGIKLSGDGKKNHVGFQADDLSPTDETSARYSMEKHVDAFQKFTSLCEGGQSLMERYEKAAKDIFGVTPGQEQGYVVLSVKRRSDDESRETFLERQREYALHITKKLSKQLNGFPQLARMSLHPTSFGEVVPVGYVPEENDVVAIDSKGVARNILSVVTHIHSNESTSSSSSDVPSDVLRSGGGERNDADDRVTPRTMELGKKMKSSRPLRKGDWK